MFNHININLKIELPRYLDKVKKFVKWLIAKTTQLWSSRIYKLDIEKQSWGYNKTNKKLLEFSVNKLTINMILQVKLNSNGWYTYAIGVYGVSSA